MIGKEGEGEKVRGSKWRKGKEGKEGRKEKKEEGKERKRERVRSGFMERPWKVKDEG